MTLEKNPQAEQMAHESMVRNLAAQAEATWPQERPLFTRYRLPASAEIVDVGCGTGEITTRLAALFPQARVLGIDVNESHLDLARTRVGDHQGRVTFQSGDAYALELPDDAVDLAVCRHLLQAVPEPERIVGELARVVRPGGVVHLVAEDYGMIHFHPTGLDTDRFWRDGPMTFARRTGTDLCSGRTMFTVMTERGLEAVRVDYLVVDTVRVARETFAAIWIAWRDGYTDAIAANTDLSRHEVHEHFEAMIRCLLDPAGYGVWHIPVITGTVPEGRT